MLPRLRATLLLSAGLAALAGCEGGSVGAGEVLVVADVEISPSVLSLVVGTSQQLQATPKTSSGITVPKRQVTWSSDAPGVATVSSSGMVTAVADGVTAISATVDGVRRSILATITPKPVVSVTIVPDQITLLVSESGDLTATPRDAAGQPLAGRPVTYSSDNPLIATVSTTGHVTAIGPGLTLVRATIEGKSGTANVSASARPATQLDFQTELGTGAAGVPLAAIRIAVQNDQGGTVTAGVIPVSIALAGNPTGAVLSGTSTLNTVNGVAIFTDLSVNHAGTGYTLRATSGTLSPAESVPFAIVAGPASALSISTQPSPAGASGTPLPRQPVVQVRDANGNAVAKGGVQVTAALEGAGATLGGTRTVATNAEGIATFTNLVLSGSAGTYTLLLAAPGLTAVASTGITLGAGAAAILRLAQQPAATAQAGVAFTQQPIVRLEDVDGNPVTQAGLPVNAALQSGGGLLAGTMTVLTDATGRASFVNLSIGGIPGARTLRFSATGVTAAISENVVVGAGPASGLAIVTAPPVASASGAVLVPAPVVQVVDGFGNPVDPDPEITITVAIASGAGGVLNGPTSVVTSNGAAVFPGLVLTGPSGGYTLRFSSDGLAAVVSNPIVIGAGVPVALFIATQPSTTAQSGAVFARQPVIRLLDGSGNLAGQSGVVVSAAIESGGGSLGGTVSRTTDAAGQAVFTDLAISGTAGPRTLRFSANGLVGATSTAIDVGVAPPSSLTILTQPSASAASGVVLTVQPAVRLTDGTGGPVNGATVTAVINSGPAGASLAGATALTDATGTATFSALALSGGPGDYTIRFESNGVTAISSTITIAPIAPQATTLVLATPPGASATSGSPLGTQPVVQVADAGGAPVALAGTTVTAVLASGPAGATLAGASAVSDAAGLAAFSSLTITGPAGSYTLRFEAGTLSPVTSGAITLAAAGPATVTILTQPPAGADNDAGFTSSSVVRVQDATGNNLAGVTVTVAVASGAGVLHGTLSRVTASDGRATFNDLRLVGLAGPYTLGFTAPGLATVISRSIVLSPGQEAVLAIQVQPSTSARSGDEFAVQPKVELRDTGGNLVTRDNVRVNADLETVTGFGSLRGSGREDTNNGVASWNNMRINGNGTFRIRFSSNGMTSVTSVTIAVTIF